MILRDGKGIIRRIWGGYSPKRHDGTFLSDNKEELDNSLVGGVILADNHFSKGKKLFKNIKFYTNFSMKKSKDKHRFQGEDEDDFEDNIAKAQEKFNKQHQKARARIETPFGWIKTKFDTLQFPWLESEDQLDYLVQISVAIYNLTFA